MIAIWGFSGQNVPDSNYKHRYEHDIAIMSLHGKYLVSFVGTSFYMLAEYLEGSLTPWKKSTNSSFSCRVRFMVDRGGWILPSVTSSGLISNSGPCFPLVIHECPKQTPINISFYVHEINAMATTGILFFAN
jgi:hypothetical protein